MESLYRYILIYILARSADQEKIWTKLYYGFTLGILTRHGLIKQFWFRNVLFDSYNYFLFLVLKPVDSTVELQWHDLFNLKGVNDTSTLTSDIADNKHVRPVEDQHGVVSVSFLTDNNQYMFFFRTSEVHFWSLIFDLLLSTHVN